MKNKEFKVRASSAYKIIAQPKSKKDKEAGLLGETAKSYVQEVFLKDCFGYEEQVFTEQMTKGHLLEAESRKMIKNVLGGEIRLRNTKNYSNKHATGTPDIILKDCIEDVKNSWNLKTFFNASVLPAYYWQAQVYMYLTGIFKYRLIYTLNPTPYDMIESEKYRLSFKFDGGDSNEDFKKAAEQIEHNNNLIYELPEKFRVKVFDIDYSQKDIDFLISQIEKGKTLYKEMFKNLGL